MSGRVLAPLGHSSLIIACYQADKAPSLIANTSFKKTKSKKTEERKCSWAPTVMVTNSILDSLGLKRPSLLLFTASLVAQRVKHLPAMQETGAQSLGWEDPLEKEMATHSGTLAWKIPWMEKPVGYKSVAGYSLWVTKSQTRLRD